MQGNNQTEFSIIKTETVAWIVTLKSGNERKRYRRIISGLLPEAIAQSESNKETMNFVLKKWLQTSDNEVRIISNLLKRGIRLAENFWWIIYLTSLGLLTLLGTIVVNVNNHSSVPISQTSPNSSTELTLNSITQQQAVNIVYTWLEAKPRIFAPPYDRQLVANLTTDERYTKTIEAIEDLQKNNAYYQFSKPEIEATGAFYAPEQNQIILGVKVTENYTNYVNNQVVPSDSRVDIQSYSVLLKLEDGRWKLAKIIR